MATKSYSKHKEFKEFSTRSAAPYNSDQQFDLLKSELLPKSSKLRSSAGAGADSEYHYEYHEDRHPSGKYERKDLHTVEQYTVPAQSASEQHNSYFFKEEKSAPAITSASHFERNTSSDSPGYSRIRSSKKEMSHNVDELDSLLDDLQRDQERHLNKSGYTSDTAESYDYRKTAAVRSPPSSGYSTLKTERQENSWTSSPLAPAPAPVTRSEFTKEMFREEKTESRVVPARVSPALPLPLPVPAPLCHQCQFPSATVPVPGAPMNKVTTTVKTYTYEVPADQDATGPELSRYLHSDSANIKTSSTTVAAPAPAPACQYCAHCSTRIARHDHSETRRVDLLSETDGFNRSERMVYPKPANEVRTPVNLPDSNGPATYKWSETSYSAYNTTERSPLDAPPSPFPRARTPAPADPPKKLDELLAEFPDARFPTQPDGVTQRKVEVLRETSSGKESAKPSKAVAGPAVYYPPGHQPFQKKEAYSYGQASAGGGQWAAGRGMYEYESGSKSKEKSSETKKVVPVCLPLCCAMPCSIM